MKKLREGKERDIYLIKEWETNAGLKAFIVQFVWKIPNTHLNNHNYYCGYVEKRLDDSKTYYDTDTDIHRGITFEGFIKELSEKELVGFDMAHYGDENISSPVKYAEKECEKLAELLTTK